MDSQMVLLEAIRAITYVAWAGVAYLSLQILVAGIGLGRYFYETATSKTRQKEAEDKLREIFESSSKQPQGVNPEQGWVSQGPKGNKGN